MTDKVSDLKDMLHRVRDDVKDRGLDAVKDLVKASLDGTLADEIFTTTTTPTTHNTHPFQIELVVATRGANDSAQTNAGTVGTSSSESGTS